MQTSRLKLDTAPKLASMAGCKMHMQGIRIPDEVIIAAFMRSCLWRSCRNTGSVSTSRASMRSS